MDWTAIVTACIAGLALIVANRQNKRSRATSKHVAEIHEEVKNTHETNARDDIDKAMAESRAANRSARAARVAAEGAHKEMRAVHARLDLISKDIGAIKNRLSTHIDGR